MKSFLKNVTYININFIKEIQNVLQKKEFMRISGDPNANTSDYFVF